MTHPVELAERLFAAETLSRCKGSQDGAEPFSLQWFLEIEALRYGRHGGWLPCFLEFTKHSGDRLLGLGAGLGTDWLQYARHGADVIACCSSSEQKTLVHRAISSCERPRGPLSWRRRPLCPWSPHRSMRSASGSLLQPEVDGTAVVEELYRVLKPGGKVLALARAYYDAEFWRYRWIPARLAALSPLPTGPAPVYKATQLRRLFARFVEHQFSKRPAAPICPTCIAGCRCPCWNAGWVSSLSSRRSNPSTAPPCPLPWLLDPGRSLLQRFLAQFHRAAAALADLLLAALDRADVAPVIDVVLLPFDDGPHRAHAQERASRNEATGQMDRSVEKGRVLEEQPRRRRP